MISEFLSFPFTACLFGFHGRVGCFSCYEADFLSKFNIPDLILARLIPASDEQTFLPPFIVHRPTEEEKSDLPPPRKFFFFLTIVF